MSAVKPSSRALILLGILLIPSLAYLIVSSGKNNYQRLEIFGPKEPSATKVGDTTYHTIASFELIAHDSSVFTDKNLEGKIYIADFFFATCQTICPKMSMQMKRVQEAYKEDPDVILISHTVDPDRDNVNSLSSYATEYGAIKGKWFFLTGEKKEIYDLARHSYFLAAMPGDGGPDDFIHSEKLVLVDKNKRIRGFYNGTDYEDVNLLIDEIKVLKWEEQQ
ncbi:MAG: SCO family protein [Bacteroidota bacterium]|nr:SCO family protein [Bacteroidota bacterium]